LLSLSAPPQRARTRTRHNMGGGIQDGVAFDAAEDKTMEDLVNRFGTRWTTIAVEFERLGYARRSTSSLRNRWQRIRHARARLKKKGAVHKHRPSAPLVDRGSRARGGSRSDEKENEGYGTLNDRKRGEDNDSESDSDSTVSDDEVMCVDDVALPEDDIPLPPPVEPLSCEEGDPGEGAPSEPSEEAAAAEASIDGVPRVCLEVFRSFGERWAAEQGASAWGLGPICIAPTDVTRAPSFTEGICSSPNADAWIEDADVSRWVESW